MVFSFGLKGQQIIYQKNIADTTISSSLLVESNSSFSTPTSRLFEYMLSEMPLSSGVSFLSFNIRKQAYSQQPSILKLFFRSSASAPWELLATFDDPGYNGKRETILIPENTTTSHFLFTSLGHTSDIISLNHIQVLYYKNASAVSIGSNVFVDTEYNLSSSFLKIPVSPKQLFGLPAFTENQALPPLVPVVCPIGNDVVIENEPNCYVNYKDTTNLGCDTVPERFTELSQCNGSACGKSGTFLYNGVPRRDVDYYRLKFVGTSNVTVKIVGDFRVKIYVIAMIGGCDGFPVYPGNTSTVGAGDTAILNISALSSNEDLYFWVTPFLSNGVPCGSNYVLIYKTTPVATPSVPVPAANPACTSTQLNLVLSPANYVYYWQGSSCGVSTANPASLAYPVSSSGTYYMRGIYAPLGCWTPCSSVSVTVNSPPNVNANANPSTLCSGAQSVLTATGATSYTWMPGSLSGSPLNVNPLASTTYTVTGTLSGCTSTSTVTVSTNPLPSAAGNIIGTSSLCAGESGITYNVGTISDATSYIWTYSGTGATINGSGNSVTIDFANNATSGTLTVKGNNSCGFGTISTAFSITVKPLPNVTASALPTTICAGTLSTLTGLGNATLYNWQPGSLSGSPVNVNPGLTTVYTVTGDLNGCTSISTVTVNTNPFPAAAGSITGNPSVCEGSNGISYNVAPIADALWYIWAYSGTGASNSGSGNSITIDFALGATSGILTVKGNNNCGDGSVSSGYIITVKPLPIVSAAGLPSYICDGQSTVLTASGNATSYVWQPGSLSGSPQNVSPSETTVFTLTGSLLGCTDTSSAMITVDPCTGISENDLASDIKVGPIPVHDQLKIECNTTSEVTVSLFTVEGKLLSVQRYVGNSIYYLPTADLSASIYFLSIRSENETRAFKIVKE